MRPVVALVGAPNSGKTTLYNWITGSKFKVVNYPGSTVEYAVGNAAPRMQAEMRVIDTPGTYSLSPKSADEEVTYKVLFEQVRGQKISHVIVVIDGTQVARHLLLALQIKEIGLPMVVVVTMGDLLRKAGVHPNFKELEKLLNCPIVQFDGILGEGLLDIPKAVGLAQGSGPQVATTLDQKIQWAEEAEKKFLNNEKNSSRVFEQTKRLDSFLLHPFWGLVFFFLIMTCLFTSIYWLAAPLMDWIDSGFSWASETVLAMDPENPIYQFLGEGLLAGFGAVLVFVPQIFILFLGIGLLEGTGYLARAATLVDQPFSKIGMSGRSFVPVLSGFACAVPAMMATRNLSSKRDRWITNFIIPLMTCSARLPVYALLLGFLFLDEPAWKAGLALAVLYFAALFLGGFAAAVLSRILPKEKASIFMMELPIYRLPKFKFLVQQSLSKTKGYVNRAGPMILMFSIIIWFGTKFPAGDLEHSYIGKLGQALTPIVEPMGADWRVGVGMISAFAAREVFVSTMAVIFNISGDEDSQAEGLLETMKTAQTPEGLPVFTFASVSALIVFFMIALQCMSTFAIAIRESGSYKFAFTQLVALNVFAYVLAVLVFQILK